jgi:hypothetical protein
MKSEPQYASNVSQDLYFFTNLCRENLFHVHKINVVNMSVESCFDFQNTLYIHKLNVLFNLWEEVYLVVCRAHVHMF